GIGHHAKAVDQEVKSSPAEGIGELGGRVDPAWTRESHDRAAKRVHPCGEGAQLRDRHPPDPRLDAGMVDASGGEPVELLFASEQVTTSLALQLDGIHRSS